MNQADATEKHSMLLYTAIAIVGSVVVWGLASPASLGAAGNTALAHTTQ